MKLIKKLMKALCILTSFIVGFFILIFLEPYENSLTHNLFIHKLNKSIKKHYSNTTTIKDFTYDWGILAGNGNHCDYATLIKTETLVSKKDCELPNINLHYPFLLCFTIKDNKITGYGIINAYVYNQDYNAIDITVKYSIKDYDLTKDGYEYEQDDTINLTTDISPELKDEIPWVKQLIADDVQTINMVLKDNSKTNLESGNYIFLLTGYIKDAGWDMRCH